MAHPSQPDEVIEAEAESDRLLKNGGNTENNAAMTLANSNKVARRIVELNEDELAGK